MTLHDKQKCVSCGLTFRPKRTDQKFHSPRCRKQAENSRKRRTTLANATARAVGDTDVAGYVVALTTARDAARKRPSDTAEKELNRLVALLVDEMKSLGVTRRQKQVDMRSGDIPTVGQLVSDYAATIENMSPAALKAHRLRERFALEKYAPRLRALGVEPDFSGEGMESEQALNISSIDPFLENLPGPEKKRLRELVSAGFEYIGFDRDQLPMLVQLAIETLNHDTLLAQAIDGAANSFRLKSVKMRIKKLECALALDKEAVTQTQAWVSPEEALIGMYVQDLEGERDERESEKDAGALLSSAANLYEAGILEGPSPAEVSAEIARRNALTRGDDDAPTLRDVIRRSDAPF